MTGGNDDGTGQGLHHREVRRATFRPDASTIRALIRAGWTAASAWRFLEGLRQDVEGLALSERLANHAVRVALGLEPVAAIEVDWEVHPDGGELVFPYALVPDGNGFDDVERDVEAVELAESYVYSLEPVPAEQAAAVLEALQLLIAAGPEHLTLSAIADTPLPVAETPRRAARTLTSAPSAPPLAALAAA
jgi:hypothetical protein